MVLSIEGLRAPACPLVAVAERHERCLGYLFVDVDVILDVALRLSTREVSRLFGEVQLKPQLDTRVRERDLDLVARAQPECLLDVDVVVAIEDTPDFVVRPAFLLCSFFCCTLLARPLRKA